ncbi:magnesium transporter [Rhodocollybia butyracea]|uniref:Magnesium transporter n=1 Tax=Rhodocollybia butyracea TaxID=206335 RepID=A0A9P5Q0L4_9AGAR|nr:magnesium transporter [Rhodocollybia butyracea]
MLGRSLLLFAILALLHAAFSTYEHFSHLKALGKPEGSLPRDIMFEAIIALAVGILGATLNAPPLKETTWSSEMKTRSIDEMDARPGFASYVNRGRNIS